MFKYLILFFLFIDISAEKPCLYDYIDGNERTPIIAMPLGSLDSLWIIGQSLSDLSPKSILNALSLTAWFCPPSVFVKQSLKIWILCDLKCKIMLFISSC